MTLEPILVAVEVAGTLAFAVSGLIEATRRRMDVIGVVSVAFASAFGGGTVRDVLLDRRPLFWVEHTGYLWLVLALTLVAPLVLRAARHHVTDRIMVTADALGLGLFAISGTSLAAAAGMPPVVSLLMGAITAVFGGVLRDVLCNEIPRVFHDHVPYTLCALDRQRALPRARRARRRAAGVDGGRHRGGHRPAACSPSRAGGGFRPGRPGETKRRHA